MDHGIIGVNDVWVMCGNRERVAEALGNERIQYVQGIDLFWTEV